jgi:N utilization substance protein A
VREVYIDDETKEATVVVPNDQLALAIGKDGLNARLAARLTGWKVDIQSDEEFAQAEAEAAFAGEGDGEGGDYSGRCAAILSNGKRCPNAALPGTRYCGVPAHVALIGTEPEETVPAAEVEETATPAEAESLEPVAQVAEAEEVEEAPGLEAEPEHAAEVEEAPFAEETPEGEAVAVTGDEPTAEAGEDEPSAS